MRRTCLTLLIIVLAIAVISCNTISEEIVTDTSLDSETLESSESQNRMSDTTIKYPANVFAENEPIELYYSKDDQEVEWLLLDWRHNEIENGIWDTSGGPLAFPDISLGYYMVKMKEKGMTDWSRTINFARVVDPGSRPRNVDVSYGFDTAQSIFKGVSNKLLSDLVVLSGSTMIRDRLNWTDVRMAGDQVYWGRIEETSNLLKEHNIKIVNELHYAPSEYRGNLYDLPYDLMAFFDFAQMAADKFSDTTPALEFWNEQDLEQFNRDSAWDFAAAQKVAYLGFKAGNPSVNVLIGSTTGNLNIRFNEVMFANGINNYFDTFNFHTYTKLDLFKEVVEGKLEMLERWGAAHKPIWITEFGMDMTLAVGQGETRVSGKAEHDEKQELIQSQYLVKGNILLQSFGIEKNFFFILPPWNGWDNSVHGLLRHDLTIKPAFVAHSNLTAELGVAKYLGKVNLGSGVEGYLYEQPDGDKTMIFWGNRTITLENQQNEMKLVDMMGKETRVESNNGTLIIQSDINPQYLHGVLNIDFEDTIITGLKNGDQEDNIDKSVVLRVDLDDKFYIGNRVSAELKEGNEAEIYLDVFNFSNEQKQVKLINNSKGCTIVGLPEYITVPPMEEIRQAITIKIPNTGLAELSISYGDVSKVYIPIRPRLDSTGITTKELENKASLWRTSTNGVMEIQDDATEDAVRFNVDFTGTIGNWLYPQYKLDSINMNNVIGLTFDIRMKEVENEIPIRLVSCSTPGGSDYRIWYPSPTEEWQRVEIIFRDDAPIDFDSEKMNAFSIGFNPNQKSVTYWIKNLNLIYNDGE